MLTHVEGGERPNSLNCDGKKYPTQETSPKSGEEEGTNLIYTPVTHHDELHHLDIRGTNSAIFRRQYTTMVKIHKPFILILLETKMTDHKGVTETLGFDHQLQFTAIGCSGGIVIVWKTDTLYLEDIYITPQGIHAMVKVLSSSHNWLLSAIYASTHFPSRSNLWDNLIRMSQNYNGDWFIGCDFNKVLRANDKWGGQSINSKRDDSLRQCFNLCNMVDLVFKGNRYTWTNKTFKNM